MTADGAFEHAAALFVELRGRDDAAVAARLAAEPDAEVRELVREMLAGDREPLSALTEGMPGLRELVDDAFADERRAPGSGASAADAAAEPAFELANGTFRIDGVLGRGGMGIVYRGHDESIGRAVAIKVLQQRAGDRAGAHLRFVEEAQVAGQLEHPGIVPIHHLGKDDRGRPFFVMKLIEGRTLAEQLAARDGPRRDLPRFLGHLLRVCQTVAYAHARGVIHRDLKPANVMIGAFGEVQVLDWGLAKVLGAASSDPDGVPDAATRVRDGGTGVPADARSDRPTTARSGSSSSAGASQEGTIMGTPGYMPPEQALGAVSELDRRADVFALGAILCEILTGMPPFAGDRRAALHATRAGQLAPAFDRLAASGADAGLIGIARRCLAPEPEDRPVDAGDLAAAIERSLGAAEQRAQDALLAAERATARAASERLARRRTVWLSAVSAVFLVALLAVVIWHAFERERAVEARSVEVGRALDVAEERLLRARQAAVEDLEPWRGTDLALAAAEQIAQPESDGIELRPAVRARVEALRTAVDTERAAAVTAAAAAAADREVRGRLEQIRTPTGDGVDPYDYPRMRAALEALFAELGLRTDDEATAAALRGHRLGSALGPALDQWSLLHHVLADEPTAARKARSTQLLALASAADPDPRREAIRQASRDQDTKRLLEFAAADADELPPQSVILLAGTLRIRGELQAAVNVLRRAAVRHGSDFWLSFHAAIALRALAAKADRRASVPLLEESLAALRAAIAARPEGIEARHLAGQTLEMLGRPARAREEFAEIVRRDPENGHARTHLGNLVYDQEGPAAALPYLARAAAAAPDDAFCVANHARALIATGDAWAGADLRRRAFELAPSAHSAAQYADALGGIGDVAGELAMREYVLAREAAQPIHLFNTGTAYSHLGDLERAEAQLRRCIEVAGETLPQAHCNLASVLLKRGRFEDALASYRDCDTKGSKVPGWSEPSGEWVQRAERAREFARAVEPSALAATLEHAEFATYLGRVELATAWYESVLAPIPRAELPREDVDIAARAAVRAAARATDPAAARHALGLAIGWFDALRELLMADFRARPGVESGAVRFWLGSWRVHADLAWLRDTAALPADLRVAATAFWTRLDGDLAEIVATMQRPASHR